MSRDRLPLDGIRVLDLSALMPGPFATQTLVDLGATVLKIERPGEGDPVRHLVPQMYEAVNRGKHSLVLDLRAAGDRALLLDLAQDAHVFVEGFRPGVVDRLGVGFDAVRARRPDIVYVSLSGYGQSGPLAQHSGHNGNYLARTGALALSGEPGQPPDESSAIPVADLAGGLYAVVGVLAALQRPDRTACHLDVSLLGAGLAWMAPRLAEYAGKGAKHRDEIMTRPASGVYRTGDGRFLTIAAVEDHFWVALCRSIGREDLARRPDLARYTDRYAHAAEIGRAIEESLATGSRDEWVERMVGFGVPASPVLEPEEVLDDPQVRHLGVLEGWPDVRAALPIAGLPSRVPARSPRLDEDGPAVRAQGWAALGGPR